MYSLKCSTIDKRNVFFFLERGGYCCSFLFSHNSGSFSFYIYRNTKCKLVSSPRNRETRVGRTNRALPHSSRATFRTPDCSPRQAQICDHKQLQTAPERPKPGSDRNSSIPQFDSIPWVGVGTATATAAGASALSPTSPVAGARGRSAPRDGWCSPAATRRKSSPADSFASARRRSSSSATASAGILACAWCFPSIR